MSNGLETFKALRLLGFLWSPLSGWTFGFRCPWKTQMSLVCLLLNPLTKSNFTNCLANWILFAHLQPQIFTWPVLLHMCCKLASKLKHFVFSDILVIVPRWSSSLNLPCLILFACLLLCFTLFCFWFHSDFALVFPNSKYNINFVLFNPSLLKFGYYIYTYLYIYVHIKLRLSPFSSFYQQIIFSAPCQEDLWDPNPCTSGGRWKQFMYSEFPRKKKQAKLLQPKIPLQKVAQNIVYHHHHHHVISWQQPLGFGL